MTKTEKKDKGPKRDIIKYLTQKDIGPEIHPNRAVGLLKAPLTTMSNFMTKLSSLGLSDAAELPDNFDWREQPGIELTPVMNQGHCGNCWAISSTQSFADRWMIAVNKTGLVLNPLQTTICVRNKKCGGGLVELCQDFFSNVGASKEGEECIKWSEYCKQQNGNCCDQCTDSELVKFNDPYNIHLSQNNPQISCDSLKCTGGFKAKPNSMISSTIVHDESGGIDIKKTINSIKTDIKLHGPVVSKYRVFGDFVAAGTTGLKFKWDTTKGIYIQGEYDNTLADMFKEVANKTQSGDPQKIKILKQGLLPVKQVDGSYKGVLPSEANMGGHAVEIVGWGKEDIGGKYGEIEYWIVKNSWGTKWNDDGYFKFAINTNGKINNKCGMDIPITIQNGMLFGGTVSFLPDTTQKYPDWEESKKKEEDGKKKEEEEDGKKKGMKKITKFFIIISIVLFVLIIFSYFLFKYLNKRQNFFIHDPIYLA